MFIICSQGVPKVELQAEIDELLNELEMSHQSSVRASKLSGGQKRKLSVAIALIGSPKVFLTASLAFLICLKTLLPVYR